MTNWTRAARCGNGACVEVQRAAGGVLIRDSKQPDGPTLAFTDDEWAVFVQGVKDGDFDEVSSG